jgi:hypothetical protein
MNQAPTQYKPNIHKNTAAGLINQAPTEEKLSPCRTGAALFPYKKVACPLFS